MRYVNIESIIYYGPSIFVASKKICKLVRKTAINISPGQKILKICNN